MTRKPVVYLAGPYSKPDPVLNMHNAVKLADSLMDCCTPVVPHLTGFWHAISPKPYEDWLAYDLAVMRVCDVVLRFKGASSGADAEVKEAQAAGLTVVYSGQELRQWIKHDWAAS